MAAVIGAALVAAVAAVASDAASSAVPGTSDRPAPPARPAAEATAVAVVDDFEDPDWPTGWPWTLPTDPEDPRTEQYQWAPRDCRASSGARSLWSVGGGTEGSRLPCGASYPANVRSVAVLHLDLRPYAAASTLQLAFDMWADTLSDAALGDFVSVIYREPTSSGSYERVSVLDWTGATGPSFRTIRLDLLDLADVFNPHNRFNLAGTEADFELVFRTARDSTFRPEGVHVDLLRLEHDLGVAETPTSGPTGEATATASAPSTGTATPGDGTASATGTRPVAGTASPAPDPGSTAYLPDCRRG